MTTIEKVIISKVQPSYTNVLWLDVSEEVKKFRAFLNGAWRPISDEVPEVRELFRLLDDKVDKEEGKTLSSNDFTDELKKSLEDLIHKMSTLAAYTYKGSCTYNELPTSGNKIGDVWNVTDAHEGVPAGTNYAWTGTEWDALGGIVDLSDFIKREEVSNTLKNYYTKTEVDQSINEATDDIATQTWVKSLVWQGTEEKFNAIETKDPETIYMIEEDD